MNLNFKQIMMIHSKYRIVSKFRISINYDERKQHEKQELTLLRNFITYFLVCLSFFSFVRMLFGFVDVRFRGTVLFIYDCIGVRVWANTWIQWKIAGNHEICICSLCMGRLWCSMVSTVGNCLLLKHLQANAY